jgi:prolyl-tRNA synthetase
MRCSRLFGKTRKEAVADAKFISHIYLTRGGFVAESVAGRYFFLPLGWRVHEKIKAIVKEEMDRAGAQEMLSPTLHPIELWQETNRTNTTGFELMQVTDRRGATFALGGTAEEMFVDVVRKFKLSYKDLPFTLYQFSTKFRDELRARGGLLRVREFTMKDAYSFDRDEAAFQNEYARMAQAYTRIFDRCGLKTYQVEADNGYIGGEYCHEFVVEHAEGESSFFLSEDNHYCAHEDVARFSLPLINPDEPLQPLQMVEQPAWVRSIEDQVQYHQKAAYCFLKSVVYRTSEGDLIIVVIRGDLEVNRAKLEHLLRLVGQTEEAKEEDLLVIGTRPGYVHAWGHTFTQPRMAKTQERHCHVIYVADHSLKTVRNFFGGQKQPNLDSGYVNYGRDFTHEIEGDVAVAQEGFLAPTGTAPLQKRRGIEVGNIFQLGYHYTTRMQKATFADRDGASKPFYMGCYGIGIGRTLATIVEKHHDERGIVWPATVAPYAIHLVSLQDRHEQAKQLYKQLQQQGHEVLWDDRDLSAGAKFADADLIGCPIRLVISPKTDQKVEFKHRAERTTTLVTVDELFSLLQTQQIIKDP